MANILKCRRTAEVKKKKIFEKPWSLKFTGIFRYLSNSMKDFKSLILWSPLHLRKLVTQFFSSQKTTFFSSVLLGLNFNWKFSFPQCTLKWQRERERKRSSVFLMDDGVSSKGLWLADFQSATSSVVNMLIHHYALQIWKCFYNVSSGSVPWPIC